MTRRRPLRTAALLALAAALAGCAAMPSAAAGRALPDPPSTTLPVKPLPASPTPTPTSSPTATPPPPAAPVAADPLAGWHLVWGDEFDGTGVDTSKWTVLDDSTFGDGNSELACLLSDNVSVRDGSLVITAAAPVAPVACSSRDPRFPDGRSYTSGLLESKGKASFEYGRFEIRAWTPTLPGASKGLWPAFWLRPEHGKRGELDVMEILGTSADTADQRNRVMQTIHDTYGGANAPEYLDYDAVGADLDSGFHTYAVEWEPGAIRWYVDDRETFERSRATTPWLDDAFTGPFFLRLNMAVGGTWAGSPDSNTTFPAEYVVDWVHVYQR